MLYICIHLVLELKQCIVADKQTFCVLKYEYFHIQSLTCVLGAQKNFETVLLSIHNICLVAK